MLSGFSLRQLNIALLALPLVAAAALALSGPASAAGVSGGLAMDPPSNQAQSPAGKAVASRFGHRVLREGMSGPDVKVLNGITRYKALLKGSAFSANFNRPTTTAVRAFQRRSRLKSNGVLNKATAKRLVRSLPVSGASWYGPGWWGRRTACGNVLRPRMLGVAHKTLPCGSKVLIGYKGRYVMTTVVDRGPYIRGRSWDLTSAAADAIGLTAAGVGQVRSAVVQRGRR